MRRPPLRRRFVWLPTLLVLAVVLGGGARLLELNVRHHVQLAHQRARATAAEVVLRIEPQLQALSVRAGAEAQRLAAAADPQAEPPFAAIAPQRGAFWMSTGDELRGALPGDRLAAGGLAAEWRAAEAAHPAPPRALIGPVRLGSEWFLAARAPLAAAASQAPRGYAVAYTALDPLLASSGLTRLLAQGYVFELSQVEPRSARARSFISTAPAPLTEPVRTQIRLPADSAPVPADSELQLALQPRAGWYPRSQLAASVALLVFLAWLLAFGTHDLTHALQRSRAAMRAAHARLHGLRARLAHEIREHHALQQTFDHERFHDPFTGLPNRRYFMDQVDRALRDLRTKRRAQLTVLIIDIVRFKLVNDMLGHTAGDELMVQAARRFEQATAERTAVLARWSGDQFMLLVTDLPGPEAAVEVARQLLEALHAPFQLRRHRLVVSATIGITSVSSGQQRAEDVVREADIALTVAKKQDSKIVLYTASMAGQAANLVSLEADLHVALERRELRLLFQPIVHLGTYQMVGAEALLRWRHPVENTLTPDRFLRIAEEAGLMVPITRWIILRTVKLAAEWQQRLPAGREFYLSVNLSPAALRDPGLPGYVAGLLREHPVPPQRLKFEVTETALISNAGAAREALDQLHALGVQLMLDDFGTGYSSLSYLQLFPFDFVKIDRPFVNRSGADTANTGMMAALVQMAHSLKLTAIAELIETEAAAKALQEMGCEYGQGYLFSEALEAELALRRLLTGEPFEPQAGGETMAIPPLPADDSPTLLIPEEEVQLAMHQQP